VGSYDFFHIYLNKKGSGITPEPFHYL